MAKARRPEHRSKIRRDSRMYKGKVKTKFRKKDILRMQDMLQNKTQVETVNFRLYFKVIIRQNEIQYFTT